MEQEKDMQTFDYTSFLTTIPKHVVDVHFRQKCLSFKDIAILKQVCTEHNEYWSAEKICPAAFNQQSQCSSFACLDFASNTSTILTLQHFASIDHDMFFHLWKSNPGTQTIKQAFGIRSHYLLTKEEIINVYNGCYIPIQDIYKKQINQLYKAIKKRKIPAIELLLQTIQKIPTIFVTPKNSNRTLLKAICKLEDLSLFKILINKNINYLKCLNQFGVSALQTVSAYGTTEMLEELLKMHPKKIDINLKAKHTQWTALHFASMHGHTENIKVLCEYGADINTIDSRGNTALHEAVQRGWHRVVAMLLSFNACQVGIPNNDLCTPLHLAASRGAIKCGTLLLKNRARINAKNLPGDTPLHTACYRGNIKFVRLLLEKGALVNPFNNINHTPLDLTLIFVRKIDKKKDMNHLLLSYGATIGPLL